MSRFWSPLISRLSPYVPGEQPKITNLTKLNTNENPYPPSLKVLEAIRAEVGDNLRLYPDPDSLALKQAIASYHGVQVNQVFVGNGSDEVLAFVFQALFKHDAPLLFPDVTYSFYPVYCGLYEIDYQTVPLADDFSIQINDYLRPNGGIIFPNPNAPTGRLLALSEIERLLQANLDSADMNSVIVVDEAYIDFGGETAISLVNSYPNLLVTHSLSKSRALAGLRVGFAVGHPDLIEALTRVKDSFNSYPLDRLAQAGAVAAFADESYFQKTRHAVMGSREALVQSMRALGFEIIPSAANFVFARHPAHDAATLAAKLREYGVIVRHFNKPRIEQYLRITIGTPQQNNTLLEALNKVLPA
ncbi:MAG: histidinol-phosphate transaminase [Halothiobacillaceae bacterium]|nr:histidinol-phosphate transaminase [Halothiobacillaceae bacterium]